MQLDPARVQHARKATKEDFQKMQMHKKAPVQNCKDATGKMSIKGRCVDTNKQDEANPKYPQSACRKRVQEVR